MENFLINLEYEINGEVNKISFSKMISNSDLEILVNKEIEYSNIHLSINVNPLKPLKINRFYLRLDYKFSNKNKVFLNGYQSSTISREYFLDEKIKGLNNFSKPYIKKHKFSKEGDYDFKKYFNEKGKFHSYTYSYIRDNKDFNLIASLNESNGFTTIDYDIGREEILIEKEAGINIISSYNIMDIVFSKGSEKDVFNYYFKKLNLPKPEAKPIIGWSSHLKTNNGINESSLKSSLEEYTSIEKKIDFFHINEGYQKFIGDWLEPNKEKFPNGIESISKKIKEKGLKPSIWIAPFICEKDSLIFKNHKEWLIKDEYNEPISYGNKWSGFYALDIYNKDFINYLKKVFNTYLIDWNFDMIKVDYLYVACAKARDNKTRGQIMYDAIKLIRDLTKDKVLLASRVPLGSAFGLVDYCRVGPDISLDWNDKFLKRFTNMERKSTKNNIISTIARRQLDGNVFLNDPHVFLLRNKNTKLSKKEKNILYEVNRIFGSILYTSDNISEYKRNKKDLIKKATLYKKPEIIEVNIKRKELVEVIYIEDDIEKLMIINMSKNIIYYQSDDLIDYGVGINFKIKPKEIIKKEKI